MKDAAGAGKEGEGEGLKGGGRGMVGWGRTGGPLREETRASPFCQAAF